MEAQWELALRPSKETLVGAESRLNDYWRAAFRHRTNALLGTRGAFSGRGAAILKSSQFIVDDALAWGNVAKNQNNARLWRFGRYCPELP